MSQAVEPLETGIHKIKETYHERIETWGGHYKEIVTKEDTYAVNDESGESGTSVVKETETTETIEHITERDKPSESHVTLTTEVSYIPESDPREGGNSGSQNGERSMLINSTSRRVKHE